MKRNSIKQMICLCALLLLSMVSGHTALAENTWKMAAKELTPNMQIALSLYLENSDDVNAFQFDIKIPNGLLLMGNPVLNENRSDGHTLEWIPMKDGWYRCFVYSLVNANLKEKMGEMLSIPILVDSSYEGDDLQMKNLTLTNQKADDLTVDVQLGDLTMKKELQRIQLTVTGLTQVRSKNKAEITVTSIPKLDENEVGFTITYFNSDWKQINEIVDTAGIYFVTIERDKDDKYSAVKDTFRMVVVDKQQPELTAPSASALNEGQLLSQSILSGGEAKWIDSNNSEYVVPGSFFWVDPNQVANTAMSSYPAIFIPNDNSRYANVEVSVPVQVNKLYKVYLSSSPGGSISVQGEHADQSYVEGQTLTLTPVPDPNYLFVRWSDDKTDNPYVIQVKKNMSISPIFERPKYIVTVPSASDYGSLNVTCDGVPLTAGEHACLKGSTILAVATPNSGYELNSLTIGNVVQSKYLVSNHVSINVSFKKKSADKYMIQAKVTGSGTVRLYDNQGQEIVPGSSLEKNTEFVAVVKPEVGNKLTELKVEGATRRADGKYVLTGDATMTATFTLEEYELTIQTQGTGTVNLDSSKKYRYGEKVTVSANNVYKLVVNGNEIKNGDEYTITGPTLVYAKFKTEIKPEYVYVTPRSFVYDKSAHGIIPFATQTYAYCDFKVTYPGITDKPIEAGVYDAHVSREEDDLYLAFPETTYPKVLTIEQAKLKVKQAPTVSDDGETDEPSIVSKASTSKYYLSLYTYTPVDTKNYKSVQYYLSTSSTKVKLKIGKEKAPSSSENQVNRNIVDGKSQLRADPQEQEEADNQEEPEDQQDQDRGYVLVTNGNMEVEDLTQIPKGTVLTLEAIAKPGYKFSGWKQDDSDEIFSNENPLRDVSMDVETSEDGETSENLEFSYIPEFVSKATLTANVSSAVPSGTLPAITVTASEGTAPTDFQVRFFADAEGSQPIDPLDVKQAGETYYVKVYREEDEDFGKLETNTIPFSITAASVPEEDIVWPTASDILEGEPLSASVLTGGSAGLIAGSFAWKEGQSDPTESGTKSYTVVFTPLDPNYSSPEKQISVNVLSKGSSTTETEKEPDTPDTPDVPDTPDTPDTPTDPDTPDVPDYPDIPDTPELPDVPDTPDQPEASVPVVAERTPTTAVITWNKVDGATSYKLFLYAKKGDVEPLKVYEFDSNGQLKSSAISFNLTELEEGKSYYITTVAYKGESVLVEKSIELSATPTSLEEVLSNAMITTSYHQIQVTTAVPVSVRVVAMTGQILFDQTSVTGRKEISVPNSGVYMVILYQGREAILQKVIVK